VKRSTIRLAAIVIAALACAPAAFAQDEDDPAVLNLAEPDFTLISLPTSLRVPTFKSAFRVTHRFARSLAEGDFGDLLEDLFGLDNGAVIGLEFRFGIFRNTEIGIHRSSLDKNIQLFAQYSILRQPSSFVDVAAWASMDGTNNFRDSYSPALGAIVSRKFGDVASVYVEPIWVNNSNPLPSELVDDNDTFIVGLGARVRIRPTVYLVGEFAPRAGGFEPLTNHGSFAIEKRVGGHMFQLNFSNSFATTMGQIARGGPTSEDWYMGFNISRKFF
jgi:hypothetical protein